MGEFAPGIGRDPGSREPVSSRPTSCEPGSREPSHRGQRAGLCVVLTPGCGPTSGQRDPSREDQTERLAAVSHDEE
ncbi:hypothetical protein NHX12_005912 [Muraenolepis orangiensis]|uniref:Uncharacterized protein n=1 Tax=Muraenolepis orangiensis TaxID=630683 RepID=A0A9Q0IDB6_9TELE|nr:hypothetical protein NHX12_005912 [Muraenolepis orangiensis]